MVATSTKNDALRMAVEALRRTVAQMPVESEWAKYLKSVADACSIQLPNSMRFSRDELAGFDKRERRQHERL